MHTRTTCRSCDSPTLDLLLDLGLQHPVDFPATPDGITKPASPVVVVRCRACTLVQLLHTVPQADRYSTYWYRSGINETMVAELQDIVAKASALVRVGAESIVLDIGANDGTLLAAWGRIPYRIAVEPAQNLYEALRPHAEQVHQVCWPSTELTYLPDRSVSVITAIAMAYGADDLRAFIAEIARLLKDDGLWIVQFQDLLSGMRTAAVDYLVHEHLMWFSLWSFVQALEAHGLQVMEVEPRVINGGSLRCYVQRKALARVPSDRVRDYLFLEAEAGLMPAPDYPTSCWTAFKRKVDLIRAAVPATVQAALDAGLEIDLYGASTKATLLLQLCGLNHGSLRWAVERQPQKVGRYVGATGIPIVSEETWRANPGGMALLGIYQFKQAVLQREQAFKGGWIIPIPHPEVYWTVQAKPGFIAGADVA